MVHHFINSALSKFLELCRRLWKQEGELNIEVEKLKAEVVKAEKSMDLAAPGVSSVPAILTVIPLVHYLFSLPETYSSSSYMNCLYGI